MHKLAAFDRIVILYSRRHSLWHSQANPLKLREQFKQSGLAENVHLHRSPVDNNGHRGCWRGHKNIAKETLRLGYGSVSIFEEDAVLSDSFIKNWREMERAMDEIGGWDIFYLAHNPEQMQVLEPRGIVSYGSIVKVKSWSTVAYTIRGAALKRLAASTYSELPSGTVDGVLHESNKAMSFYPMPVTHPDNWSRTVLQKRHLHWSVQEKILYTFAQNCHSRTATFNDISLFVRGQGDIHCRAAF